MPWIPNHKHKFKVKITKSSRSSSKVVGLGPADLCEFPTLISRMVSIMSCVSSIFQESKKTLQWCHNEHRGVSNHQPHDCLLNHLFRRSSKKTSKLRFIGLCVGNSPMTVCHMVCLMWVQNSELYSASVISCHELWYCKSLVISWSKTLRFDLKFTKIS